MSDIKINSIIVHYTKHYCEVNKDNYFYSIVQVVGPRKNVIKWIVIAKYKVILYNKVSLNV